MERTDAISILKNWQKGLHLRGCCPKLYFPSNPWSTGSLQKREFYISSECKICENAIPTIYNVAEFTSKWPVLGKKKCYWWSSADYFRKRQLHQKTANEKKLQEKITRGAEKEINVLKAKISSLEGQVINYKNKDDA